MNGFRSATAARSTRRERLRRARESARSRRWLGLVLRSLRRAPLYIAAAAIAVFTLFPFYWMLVTAFRAPTEVLTNHTLNPGQLSLSSMESLLWRTSFSNYYINSIVVACTVTVGTLLITPPIAYVLARLRSRSARLLSVSVLISYMYPEIFLILPIYVGLVKVQLDNNPFGLALALLAVTTPMGIWLLGSFFSTLPSEVEEASVVDGATVSQTLWHVVIPMARPGFVTVGIFSFIFAWVDYTFALILISSDESRTLPIGLTALSGEVSVNWGEVMAGSVLASVPILLLMGFVGNYFIRGLTVGAVKG